MFVVECPVCIILALLSIFRACLDGSAKQAKKRLLNNFYCSF